MKCKNFVITKRSLSNFEPVYWFICNIREVAQTRGGYREMTIFEQKSIVLNTNLIMDEHEHTSNYSQLKFQFAIRSNISNIFRKEEKKHICK